MEQVLLNLAINARDAMPNGGVLTAETTRVELDDTNSHTFPQMAPGAYVSLSVHDTGCGMDEQVRSQVFEPFFTTKEHGTGLGLATVYEIVRRSGGVLSVTSVLGEGTQFEVKLPLVEETAQTTVPETSRDSDRIAEGAILLVEGDPNLREVTADVLRDEGYRVWTAADAEEALRISADLDNLDLLLTDLDLPRRRGAHLAESMTVMIPKLRVLFVSGDGRVAPERKGMTSPENPVLRRPFSSRTLLRRVQELLSNEPGK
jgi:CheY-like chemotaxis protein